MGESEHERAPIRTEHERASADRVTHCPICHERVLSEAVTGCLHVHYAEDIPRPEPRTSAGRRAPMSGGKGRSTVYVYTTHSQAEQPQTIHHVTALSVVGDLLTVECDVDENGHTFSAHHRFKGAQWAKFTAAHSGGSDV